MSCQCFRTIVYNNTYIPRDAIKVHLPKVRQELDYSCGAASLKAVCKYFKVGPTRESDYVKILNTTYRCGTCPPKIAKIAKQLGLNVRFKPQMTLKQLKRYLDQKIPVICSMQAWGVDWQYPKAMSGHYVIAIGYDDKNFYFEDPAIESHSRGFLPFDVFDERWHDVECDGIDYWHLGIALWKKSYKKPEAKLPKATRIN